MCDYYEISAVLSATVLSACNRSCSQYFSNNCICDYSACELSYSFPQQPYRFSKRIGRECKPISKPRTEARRTAQPFTKYNFMIPPLNCLYDNTFI